MSGFSELEIQLCKRTPERAANPELHWAAQVILSQERDSVLLHSLASNPALAGPVQAHLAKQPARSLRLLIVAHPNLKAIAQEVLASDEDIAVRRVLASHPGLAPSVQPRLASDQDRTVRSALAANRSLQVDDSFPYLFCTDHAKTFLSQVVLPNGQALVRQRSIPTLFGGTVKELVTFLSS